MSSKDREFRLGTSEPYYALRKAWNYRSSAVAVSWMRCEAVMRPMSSKLTAVAVFTTFCNAESYGGMFCLYDLLRMCVRLK